MVSAKLGRGPVLWGAIAAALVAWEGHRYWSRETHLLTDPRYLLAVRDLSAGEVFGLRDFTFTFEAPDQTSYTDQDLGDLVGKRYRISVPAGQYLTVDAVGLAPFAEAIPKGTRAYAFLAENPLPLQNGDHIDVFAKKNGKNSRLILENLLVLRKRREGQEVSVAASRHDIELLENAQDNGKLVVALRNPGDKENEGVRMTRPKKSIEVLTEGGE